MRISISVRNKELCDSSHLLESLNKMVLLKGRIKHCKKWQFPTRFWTEAISTACYIINRVYVNPGTKTTPYKIWRGNNPNLSHLHIFGCVCYILNDRENLGKFDSRSNEGIFLDYSTHSMAFKVYNRTTKMVSDAETLYLTTRVEDLWKK